MRVSVGDVRLFFDVSGHEWAPGGDGRERRPTLIGLHGGPGLDGGKLRYQLEPLAGSACVVVPDQRGHGHSDRGSPETWNLDTWAADVKSLAGALDLDRPVVLGVSFGGFVAQRYAGAYPEDPGGLILVSTAARLPAPDETAARLREVGGEEAEAVFWRNWETSSEEGDAEWRRVVGPLMSVAKTADPTLEQLRASRIETMEVNHHFMEEEGKALDLREGLGRVRCRTLVLAGAQDPLVPADLGREIAESVPDGLARFELIENASHDVFADNPEDSYRIVRGFLRDLVP